MAIYPSRTHKLRVQGSDFAVYLTVCRDPVSGDVCGIFVNSKAMESFQWITALMTSYTRLLAAGVPLQDILSDMKETFDPHGDYLVPKRGKVNSVVHHMALVIEEDEANERRDRDAGAEVRPDR